MSHGSKRNFYFQFPNTIDRQAEDLKSIEAPCSANVFRFRTHFMSLYVDDLPVGCLLDIYSDRSKSQLIDDDDILTENHGTQSNPLIIDIIAVYKIKVKYENTEAIFRCSSKDYPTVGHLLKKYPFNEFRMDEGPRELYSPDNDPLQRNLLLCDLQPNVTYTLIVGDPLTQKQSARYLTITEHLKSLFMSRLKLDNPALNHLHDKLGNFAKEWNSETYYYPGTSIIQTSGSGKSRTTCALSQLGVFVVYCSFMGTNASGYPPRSSVADILSDTTDHTTTKENQFLYYYIYWLEALLNFLEQFEDDGISSTNITDAAIKFLNDRDKLMLSVKNRLMLDLPLKDPTEAMSDFKKYVEKLSKYFALKPQKDQSKPNQLHVLFVFDEARELIPKSKTQCNPFACMRRTAGFFPNSSGLFVLLLDTASRVSNMAPGAYHDPSARVRSLENKLFAPIYTIDTMDILRVKNYENFLLEEPFKPPVRYRFGRPLWGALMGTSIQSETNDMDEDTSNAGYASVEDVKELAKEKLVGGGGFFTKLMKNANLLRREDAVAILSVRVPIKVTNSHLASTLIANHMSWCVHITEDRYGVMSYMPSEPVIADASAELMKNESLLKAILCQYSLSAFDGSIDVGENGELVAELVLLFARDKTVKNNHYGPVLLKEFFSSLLDENNYKALEKRCQAIAQLRGKDNPLENGLVSFNHFCRVNDCLNSDHLLEMFVRGIGIVCKKNQMAVDLVIPVLMKSDNEAFKAENMSYILIQVKNRFKGKDSYYPYSARMAPDSVIKNPNTNHFYFSMYMDVGSKTCRMDFPEILTSNDKPPMSQRITFALHGLDSLLYPVLKDISLPSSEMMEELDPYLDSNESVEAMDLDVSEEDDMAIVQYEGTPTRATLADTTKLFSITGTSRNQESEDGIFTLLFRALLGRTFDPSSLHSNIQDKHVVTWMCMPLYPDKLLVNRD